MIKIKNLNKSSMPVLNNIFKTILETPLMPGVEKQKHTMKKKQGQSQKKKKSPHEAPAREIENLGPTNKIKKTWKNRLVTALNCKINLDEA